MIRPEVVDYLRENLPKCSVEEMRLQLESEGVGDADFRDSLAEAMHGPRTKPPRKKAARSAPSSKILIFAGFALILGVAVVALARRGASPAPSGIPNAADSAESGFVGPQGWVVRLPKGYAGVSKSDAASDPERTDDVIYFCPRGTDPTNFIDKGLYGQLGIVRMEIVTSRFPANLTGAGELAEAVSRKTSRQGETFVMKNIQIGTLPGVQVNVQSPYPRVEAYILGRNDVYFFYGGEDDEIWRAIVFSLRDAQSED
jgi:hypothetical protein